MWRSRGPLDRRSVRRSVRRSIVCIACGESVLREHAREYDKEGDRWTRRDKTFEHLCRDCDDERCHRPRVGLESLLCAIDAGNCSQSTFLARYAEAISVESSTRSERER